MRTIGTMLLAVLLSLGFAVTSFATIVGTPHDLSNRTGTATQNDEVCIYCHTPHQAKTSPTDYNPLWNMAVTADTYAPYTGGTDSATFEGVIGDPLVGPSRLCMSCHDGTIAVDNALTAAAGGTGTNYINPGKLIGAGTTLGSDHPIGFDYTAVADSDSGIEQEDQVFHTVVGSTLGGSTILSNLFNETIMTCATCHDVHERGGTTGMFLLGSNEGSALCLSCHIK